MTDTAIRNGRLSAEDWTLEALDQIAEAGLASVAVEPLARRLGVTKGSFYWHFPSRDALLQAALERWERDEQAAYGALESIANPTERLRTLFKLIAQHSKTHVIYSELLKAAGHPAVDAVLAHVLERRIGFLFKCFREAGLSQKDALNRARMTYAMYVGVLQLELPRFKNRQPIEGFDGYIEHMMATLVPPG
ncbi:TetR/AcrR family transcriptional regulator [Thermomonas hydrothermalis]|uniref:Transcriptional regulator, TetR family n=1 Tax=Thermomonas hydrothermalis TaxID=213588 RepID=A0A1M4SHC3_9GAMM|nr:TetR/AcrR family transcriptional regulator [Thermomonas hydrothermalis]MCL6619113.1 TetR/AcrR family transcriptional regulator [Thermomonas hydrothermalis]SHE31552.1 transcriptional regulator, TetR family [Thermomonas hydrothermalis]